MAPSCMLLTMIYPINTMVSPARYGMAILRKIAASMGTMTIMGMAKDRKLNITTRNTPSMDNKFTLELSAVIVVLISCVEGVSPTR